MSDSITDLHPGMIDSYPPGTMINRWPRDSRRYPATQAWIDTHRQPDDR